MEKIMKGLECMDCQKTLNVPITLPCGHSICKIHADQTDKPVKCSNCGKVHDNQGFAINTALLEIIESQIASIDFGPFHKEAKEACRKLRHVLDQVDAVLKDPIYYFDQVVDELKHRVLQKSEKLKLEIDLRTEQLLVVLSDYQNRNLNEYERSMKNWSKCRNETDTFLKESLDFLRQLKVDNEKWRVIKNECERKCDELSKELKYFKNHRLMDELEEQRAQVDNFVKVDLNPLFGWRIMPEIFYNKQMEQLRKLCRISPQTKWTLLWRGSRDGFGAKDFHSRCDYIPKTLTIIETTQGYIFGGYTELTWDCVWGYGRDQNAYIFSLVNHLNTPFVMKISRQEFAIYACHAYGPVFGAPKAGGCDHFIHICNDSNKTTDNHSTISSYHLPENLKMYPHILAGSRNFQVKEIEVYQLE